MLSKKLTKSLLRTTDNYIKGLEKAGISTISDLLNHFPRDYDDRTNVLDSFSLINIKEKNTILVKLLSINSQKTANNKLLTKAVLEDKNGFLAEAVFFNRKYLASQLKVFEQKKVIVSGKVKYAYGKVTFQSPEVETDLDKLEGQIVPIYAELNYIPSKWIEGKISLLKSYIKDISEDLPESIIKKYSFISKRDAVSRVHFPKNKNDIEVAQYRLAYSELFEINYKAISEKYKAFSSSEGKSLAIPLNPEKVKEILAYFPFEFTNHQKIVLFQILKDMEKSHSMQRLLEGDVGTGKTAVAFVAGVHAILETRTSPQPSPLRGEGVEQYSSKTSPQPSPLEVEGVEQLSSKTLLQYSPLEVEGVEQYLSKTSPLTPLLGEERGVEHSVRKLELKSPFYVFDLAKKFRKNPTKLEEIMWKILKNRKFQNLKFRRQHPIGRYIADFYSEELKLVFELDGKIHDFQKEYDEERNNLLKNYGFNILRLKNEELENLTELEITTKLYQILPSSLPKERGLGGEVCSGECIKSGVSSIQVAIMTPTEILARQHFEGMQDFLMNFGISSHLLVGSLTAKQKKAVKEDIKQGNIDIVIGTHTLVQEDIIFNNLGFVVVDEQHRFGVKQREKLENYHSQVVKNGKLSSNQENKNSPSSPKERGVGGEVCFGEDQDKILIPHNLNMTATPIPRTLALTLYGDQDLSIISEYPKGRKEIFTKVAKNEEERISIENFVRAEVEKGRQVFWISPLVEESEKIDLANAINTFENLEAIFAPYKVGLLHGKMKAKEKDKVMKDFQENKIQILSSTSVVEVGVDVPNATIMCIESAERFGLSQLHQFRGRVGRGAYQSYCYLFPTNGFKTDRLKAMEQTNNGFELAEIDLELRGPGEVYGVRQSGLPDLKIAKLTDLELISQIREDIEEMFQK